MSDRNIELRNINLDAFSPGWVTYDEMARRLLLRTDRNWPRDIKWREASNKTDGAPRR